MNQEEKIIKIHLETRAKLDYMIFNLDDEIAICMNNDESQNDLRILFTKLLEMLFTQNINLEYEEKSEFKKLLYIDVCKEYIKELNREISNVKKNKPENLVIPEFLK